MSSRYKTPVIATGLVNARAGRGGGTLPWRYILHFALAGGIAPVAGREAQAILTPGELRLVVGAIPASLLEGEDDVKALMRVQDILRRQDMEGTG